jgi:hypothetical protein
VCGFYVFVFVFVLERLEEVIDDDKVCSSSASQWLQEREERTRGAGERGGVE